MKLCMVISLGPPIDLIPMSPLQRASESAKSFVCRMSNLHKSISNQITMSNVKYKALADIHRWYKRFNVGNFVMIRLRPERFPPGTFQKLQARGMGPFEVLSKVGENRYVIDIPHDWGIHPTFNVEDLVAYEGSVALPSNPPHEPNVESNHNIPEFTPNPYPESSTRHYRTDIIESILDDQLTVTRGAATKDTWFVG